MNKKATMKHYLSQSITQYEQIFEHCKRLDKVLLSGNYKHIQMYTDELQKMQDLAQVNDQHFLHEFNADPDFYQADPLNTKRTEIIKQIIAFNKISSKKVQNILAVNGHELQQIKGGQTAVAGYRKSIPPKKLPTRIIG